MLDVSACKQLSVLGFSGCTKLKEMKVSSRLLESIAFQEREMLSQLQVLHMSGCSCLLPVFIHYAAREDVAEDWLSFVREM